MSLMGPEGGLSRQPGEGRLQAQARIRGIPWVLLPEPARNCDVCGVNVLLHHLRHLTNWCREFEED